MIPDAQKRLEAGLTDVKALVVRVRVCCGLIDRKLWTTSFQVKRSRKPRLSFRKARLLFRGKTGDTICKVVRKEMTF
jgi:hypothetical protein